MFDKKKLSQLLEFRKAEMEELNNREKGLTIGAIKECKADIDFNINDEIKEIKKKKEVLKNLISNAEAQIKNIETIETNIENLKKLHSEMFKTTYRLLNTKL